MARSRGAINRLQFRNQQREARRIMESDPVQRGLERQANAVIREFKRNAEPSKLTGQFQRNVRKTRARGFDGRPCVRVEIFDSPDELTWRGSSARSIEFGTNDTEAKNALTNALNAVGRGNGGLRGGLARGVGPRGGAV
jgi:hypothetical protein